MPSSPLLGIGAAAAFGLVALSPILAQQPAPAPAEQGTEDPYAAATPSGNLPPSFRAVLIRDKDGRPEMLRGVFVFKMDGGKLVMADNAEGRNFGQVDPASIKNLAIEPPEDITAARDAYRREEYSKAEPLLAAALKRYRDLRDVPGSPIPTMEVQHIDCLRRTKKWDAFRNAVAGIQGDRYPVHLRPEITAFTAWDAHRTKDWKRAEILTRGVEKMLPGPAMVQMAFIRGEALSGLGKKRESLTEYHRAMVGDFTRSRDLMGDSALASLAIYLDDPLVKDFFQFRNTPLYNPEAAYVVPAREAAWIAQLVSTLKPGGRSLPPKAQELVDAYSFLQKGAGAGQANQNPKSTGTGKDAPTQASPAEKNSKPGKTAPAK